MSKKAFIFDCDVCGSSYQMGPHRYEGKKCSGYNIFVCKACYESNWDGWAPIREARIEKICEERNIPVPSRNSKGWYPREF